MGFQGGDGQRGGLEHPLAEGTALGPSLALGVLLDPAFPVGLGAAVVGGGTAPLAVLIGTLLVDLPVEIVACQLSRQGVTHTAHAFLTWSGSGCTGLGKPRQTDPWALAWAGLAACRVGWRFRRGRWPSLAG